MTDQERQLIEGLANRVAAAPAPQIDRDADAIIRQKIGARQDALYILTQTVLVQEMALAQAKQQTDELKKQIEDLNRQPVAQSPSSSGGFLHSGAPSSPPQGWGSAPVGGYAGGYAPPPPPQASQPQYTPPAPAAPAGGGMGSFLKTAATTAAGVVAGEAVFSGLSSLFGGHHGGGNFFGGGGGVSPGSTTIIENTYESPRDDYGRGDGDSASSFGRDDDRGNYMSPDIEDRRHDSFASAPADDAQADDDQYEDDTQTDDSYDDSSSDDSGSDDSGGDDSY